MDFVIKKYNKNYEINVGNLTQVLGHNFETKEYIYQSILKHFSLYKYHEYDEHMENNIISDGETPGRKEFRVISIRERNDLIDQIRIAKNTLIYEYLKSILETLQCQRLLNVMDENLTNIYDLINKKINKDIGIINIDYEMEDLLHLVSKSTVYTDSDNDIETLGNYELLMVFLKLVERINSTNSEKIILLFKNIDHLCSGREYEKIIEYLLGYDERIFVFMFISLDKYVYISRKVLNNIIVFNDTVFQVPEYEAVDEYISNHYPINCEFHERELFDLLKCVLNEIGIENDMISYRELLVKKLLNKASCINDIYDFNIGNSELACLNAR